MHHSVMTVSSKQKRGHTCAPLLPARYLLFSGLSVAEYFCNLSIVFASLGKVSDEDDEAVVGGFG